MCYKLTKASEKLNIKEQEYICNQTEIRFGKFTSCIGVVTLNNDNTLSAAHLVLWSKDGEHIDKHAQVVIDQLKKVLGTEKRTFVIGCISWWENLEFYTKLIDCFNISCDYSMDRGTGIYGAKVSDYSIFFTYNNSHLFEYTL